MRLDGDTFFVPTHFYNVLGTRDPALRVSDGDAVVTSTLDAGGRDQANIERAPKPNPVTGPFFVEGVSWLRTSSNRRPCRICPSGNGSTGLLILRREPCGWLIRPSLLLILFCR
jgi:hypothetical protein